MTPNNRLTSREKGRKRWREGGVRERGEGRSRDREREGEGVRERERESGV